MATNYVMKLIDICGKLGVEVPTNIRADQRLTIDLIEQCISKVNDLVAELESKVDMVDTSDATATEADIAVGKTAYADGEKLLGTMLRVEFEVTQVLTGCTDTDEYGYAGQGLDYTSVLVADAGFVLPDTITVTMGAAELEQGVDYSYDAATGVYVVYAVSGAPTITAVATAVHAVTRTLTGCTDTNTDEEVEDGENHSGVLVADAGFVLPETITVTMDGSELVVDTGYTYTSTTGEYTVPAVDGPLTIAAVATESTGD